MSRIPSAPGFDSTFSLIRNGYTFISNHCNKYHTDLFQTRLMLRKVVCMSGEEAAKLFYNTNLFKREGAAPKRLQKTLFGQGGVQGLDGKAHHNRKQMLMSLMSPESIRSLTDKVTEQWFTAIAQWEQRDRIELFYETNQILCTAACQWAGVELKEADVESRTQEFMAIIDGAGGIGPRYWRGRRARVSLDKWLIEVVEQIRTNPSFSPKGSAASVCAEHRDSNGDRLPANIAAVELNNVIRPTVAIARYITFAALALHEHPQYVAKLRSGGDEDLVHFVHEIRRFYPFFPAVAAVTKEDFSWRGHHFPKGQWVILDLHGTNHDQRYWEDPDLFQPNRFQHWDGNPYSFIPQGGGDHYQNHRCAGEWVTIEVMKVALRILTQEMDYRVPKQDLRIHLARMPAIPKSRFLIDRIHSKSPAWLHGVPSSAELEPHNSEHK